MTTLGLLAVARNEGFILEEFFEHYIRQGVDHFYIVDNNSTDNSFEIYEKYSSILTLKHEPKVMNLENVDEGDIQVPSYGKMYPEVTTEWLYICDVDEFAYARRGYNTIKDFLIDKGHLFDQYLIKLKLFTDNGNILQPKSIIEGCTKRHDCSPLKKPISYPVKSISRTKKIRGLSIVNQRLTNSSITADGTLTHFYTKDHLTLDEVLTVRQVSEELYEQAYIVSNHYMYQSKEYWDTVKVHRGRASRPIIWHGEAKSYYENQWSKLPKYPIKDDFELLNITKNFKSQLAGPERIELPPTSS
jgi:hypothetical protein